jgi:hypothetical protein
MASEGIRYRGHLALICSFDDSTWVRMGRPEQGLVQKRFAGICREYHNRINAQRKGWCESNGLNPDEHEFAPYLYNPACFLTFGHTDSVGLVLVDDIDAMLEITADMRSPVEQVHLAYCPDLSSLGLANRPLFCELHELFDGTPEFIEGGGVLPGIHSVQTFAPLFLWARLKLNGIGLLGEGLLVQQAAYRTIAERIESVVATLSRNMGGAPNGVPLIEPRDLDPSHLRVAFLDPQGAEEITLLVFCRNYTVGISLLTAVRALTLGDVFGTDPRIPRLLDALGLHTRMVAACERREPTESDTSAGLRANHLLSKSYTTLGVAYHEFAKPVPDGCGGYVLAYPSVDINPGHLAEVEPRLLYPERVAEKSGVPVQPLAAVRSLGRAGDLHRFLVGRHDYLFHLQPKGGDSPVVGLDLSTFFQLMRLMYQSTGCATGGGQIETGLLDISTALVIPFPKIVDTEVGRDAILGSLEIQAPHQPIMPVLERLRMAAFSARPVPTDISQARAGAELDDHLRLLGLPSSLRRTIRYFYQDFLHCLADPFLFEGVLDLYDTFSALHTFLFETVPEPGGERGVFNAESLTDLEALLRALHNALTHRIQSSLPHWELRDMAVDFRGGLNRLVAAADVPLKCGLGIVRRQLESRDEKRDGRDFVGAVTQVTFNPNPYVYPFSAGEKCGVWLAHIDMDVAHIVNPFEYVVYVHESCHLILRSRSDWATCLGEATKSVTGVSDRELAAEILEEAAVEMLTYLFVFAPNAELYQTHFAVRINSTPGVAGVKTKDALGRFGEVLVRAFFATDPGITCGWTVETPVNDSPYAPAEDEACKRFLVMARRLCLYFREYDTFVSVKGKVEDYEQFLAAMFRSEFHSFRSGVAHVWVYVSRLFHETVLRSGAIPWTLELEERQAFDQRIADDIAQGAPFLRGACRANSDEPGYRFDEFFLVTRLLRHYLAYILGRLDPAKAIHSHRPAPQHFVDTKASPGGGRSWNGMILDPFRSGVMCLNPTDRAEKLRRQIAVMKTLWDQSCTLRARRLHKLLGRVR